MLTNADRRLIRRDTELPGLEYALNVDALLCRLGGIPGLSAAGGQVCYLRYKPGTSVVCAIELTTPDGTVPAFVKAVRPSDVARLDRLDRGTAWWGPITEPSTAVVLAPISSDRKLPGLRGPALDIEAGKAESLGNIQNAGQARHAGHADNIAILRYKPERRWVGRSADRELIKVHRPDVVPTLLARRRLLSHTDLPVPPLTRVVPRAGLMASTWVDGVALDTIPYAERPWERLGAMLARVHQVPASTSWARPESERRELAAATTAIATAAPKSGTLARWVAERCCVETPGRPRTVLHGDFSADQVLWEQTSDRLWLTDLDRVQDGDPARDVGSFVAAEILAAVRAGASTTYVSDGGTHSEQPWLADGVRRLLQGYHSVAGAAATELVATGVRRQTAAALLRKAIEPFRYREPAWPEQTSALVRAAADRLVR